MRLPRRKPDDLAEIYQRTRDLHDHANRAPFGFDRDRQAIPGWWFTCPRCGSTPDAQEHVLHWTPAGIEWTKANPDHVGELAERATP